VAMRVFVQYEKNDTGKGCFLDRLEREIRNHGVKFEYKDPKKCDVSLSFTHWRKPCSLPSVLRIDGIYLHLSKSVQWRNDVIKRDIKKADAVIWQSKFCYKMVGNMLAKGKRNYTIFNGMNPSDFDDVKPIESPYKRNIVFSAKWGYKTRKGERVFKRYKDCAKIARNYTEMDKNACCWILGNTPDKKYRSDRVKYLGWLKQEKVKQYLKMADCIVHIPYFDWCPNSVVEALAAGCYGIAGNSGGQSELVGEYGTVVQIDTPMKPKHIQPHKVPKIDRGVVLHAIEKFYLDKPAVVMNPNIHIENVAKQYAKVFTDVLN